MGHRNAYTDGVEPWRQPGARGRPIPVAARRDAHTPLRQSVGQKPHSVSRGGIKGGRPQLGGRWRCRAQPWNGWEWWLSTWRRGIKAGLRVRPEHEPSSRGYHGQACGRSSVAQLDELRHVLASPALTNGAVTVTDGAAPCCWRRDAHNRADAPRPRWLLCPGTLAHP